MTGLPALWRREFAGYSSSDLQADLLAGLTVAAVALPLALAFGVASGADAAADSGTSRQLHPNQTAKPAMSGAAMAKT